MNATNTRIMESDSDKAVVSKATARPLVISDIDVSSWSGVMFAMANVIPITVPRNPRIGMAQVIVRIKALCKMAGIARLDVGPKGANVQFHNDKFANPAGLVEFIRAQGPAARIAGNKIMLIGEMKSEADRVKGAFNIARELAEKVKAAKV